MGSYPYFPICPRPNIEMGVYASDFEGQEKKRMKKSLWPNARSYPSLKRKVFGA
jgi:hypothetical protein